ncbi:hypothetical protein BGW80DRAFT_1268781, partial [Lactifluus volemus]
MFISRHCRPFHRAIIARGLVSPQTLNIKLPDLSAPPLQPQVHIPFTPDFWESSRAKAEAALTLSEEPHVPKVNIVAVDANHADSMHHISAPVRDHLIDGVLEHEPSSSSQKISKLRNDVPLPKDLGVLRVSKVQQALLDDLIEETTTSTGKSRFHTRTLDKHEVRSVWILMGLFAGSWLAGDYSEKSP